MLPVRPRHGEHEGPEERLRGHRPAGDTPGEGLLRQEDYNEVGGTEINLIWCDDPEKLAAIQKILEDYTVDDPELGKVKPLTVVNRQEMEERQGLRGGGKVRPRELYSEYWINNPDDSERRDLARPVHLPALQLPGDGARRRAGERYQQRGFSMGINVPETCCSVCRELTAAFRPTTYRSSSSRRVERRETPLPASILTGEVEIGDIAPTIYGIMGWPPPACVDGTRLP